MTSAVYHKVLDECCVENNGKKYAWTIPLACKAIRVILRKGEQVDPRIMRPSTSQILGAAMKTS